MEKICWLCGGELPQEITEKLGTPITDLGLSGRAFNVLDRRGVETLEQLLCFEPKELLRFRNMGQKTLDEIIEKVKVFGFAIDS